jgi:hypothetical protein
MVMMSHETLSAEGDAVRRIRMNDPNNSRAMKKSNNKPDEVCALFDYLLSMLPKITLKRNKQGNGDQRYRRTEEIKWLS